MSDQDRKVGLRAELDASGIKSGVNEAKDALKQIPAAARDAAAGAGAPMEELGRKTEAAGKKAEASAKSLISQIQRTDAALASGGKNTAAYFETIGKQRGIDPNVLAPYLAQLKATEVAQSAAGKSLDKVGVSAAQTAAALRGVPAQFTDIVVALQGGQQPLTVLLQQGGQLKDMFGGIGNAAKALGGYVVGLINPFTLTAAAAGAFVLAAYQGSQELPKLQRELILSGDAAGYTRSQLAGARDAVADLAGSTKGRAAEVLGAIASSAGIGADNLQRFTVAAVQFERAGGGAAETVADAFKSLAKDPLTAALKLNETTNFLTRSTYQQIAALVEQGRSTEAARIAQEAYYDAVTGKIPKLEENLGLLQRAWRGAADGAKKFWDAALDIGREDSLDQKLQKARDRLSVWQGLTGTPSAGPSFNPLAGMFGGQVDAARDQVRALEEQQRQEAAIAKEKAEQLKLTEAKAKWDQQSVQYLSETEQVQRELNKLWNAGIATISASTIAEDFLSIADAMLKASQRLPDGVLDRVGEAENARSEQIKRSLIEVNALREQGRISEFEAIERSAALEQAGFASQRRALQERLAYVKERQNSEKEASSIQAQLAAVTQASLTAERAARERVLTLIERGKVSMMQAYEVEAQQNRADIDSYERRQYENRVKLEQAQRANAEALKEENDLLMIQAGMVGSSETARARALEFYRIELSLKKQIKEIDETDLPGGEAEREEKRATARAQAAQRRLQAAQREFVSETNRSIDTVASGLSDALMRGFENGKGYAENFIDTLKSMFGTLVLKPIIEPIFRSVAGNLVSMFGGSGSSAGGLASIFGGSGGSGGAMSLASMGSNIYNLFQTGIGSSLGGIVSGFGNLVGSANISAFGSGMGMTGAQAQAASAAYNGAGMSGVGSSIGYGSMAGSAAGALALLYAGRSIGQMLSGNLSVGGSPNRTINLGMLSGLLYGGGVFGAALGGVAGGLVNRAFGRGPKEITEQGLVGSIGGGDFTGQAYADWKQKGGWFRSNKYGTEFGDVSAEFEKLLDTSAKQLFSNTSEWAKALGLPAAELTKVTTSIKTKLTGNADEDQKALEAELTKYQEALSNQFKDALVPFQKAGEDLTTTLQRLSGLQQFSDTINSLGGIFSQVARSSVGAKESLLELVGGADRFIQMATGFVGNYYSREEIAGGKAADIQQQLKDLGLNMDFTATDAKSQFRALVEGTDVSTADGQKRLATLLGLQGDFANVADYLNETGKSLSEVANQAPGFDVLAPLLANGTTQQVQATNEVTKAIERLTEVVQQGGGGGSGDGFVKTWREVGLAVSR